MKINKQLQNFVFLVIFFLILLSQQIIAKDLEKLDYTTDNNNGGAGVNWGASSNIKVLSDENPSTFYGLMGSQDVSITFKIKKSLVDSLEISWYAGPNNFSPGNYYFGYLDDKTKEFIFPEEWDASGKYQEFNKTHNLTLNNPAETTQIIFVRPGTGAKSGIAVSEFHIFSEGKTRETETNYYVYILVILFVVMLFYILFKKLKK